MSGVETEVKPVSVADATVEPVHQQPHDSHDEEYESADDAYEEEEVEVEEEVEEEEEEEEEEERSASQQEQEKELDDDEDVKNPQFIPKRGYFYEHDDRTKAEEETEVVEEPKKEEKKPPVKEPTKWSHDMYNEDEQTPKSKDELSRAYGYDIFTEEQAPRARRRRRYGRGPNKYTRQWEDEEAYQKPRGGGFRGRGSRGRGNFRGSNRPAGDENHVEEEFPALPGSETPSKPPSSSQSSQPSKPSFNRETQPSQRRGSGENSSRPQHQQENRRRNNDYDNDRSYGPRGDGERGYGRGRGGGGPSGRGRGRRNEFSNRNRYPNRRDGEDEGGNDQQQERSSYHQNQNTTAERERPANRPRPAPASQQQGGTTVGQEMKDGFNRPRGGGPTQPQHSHPQTNGHLRDSRPSKDSPLPSKPPFTNTEYTGSHSLTANRGATSNRSHQTQGGHHHEDQQQQGRKGPQDAHGHSNILAEKGVTDLREVLNTKRQQHQPGQSSDRRMPPRLQQQQQQQSQQQQQLHQSMPLHHPQQPPPPHQHQMQQLMEQQQPVPASGKPKRFSAQRQRQAEQQQQSIPTTSGGGGIQTSGPMGHAPPNMMPVVSEQMVSTPGYPQQAPGYYEGPVTVATGTSVSPSMWTPHAYASNAPYPSPPTGPQVPQQTAFGDHAAFIAAQQGGTPIYAAPPPFIQDPGMLNYNTGAPSFAPAYHPQAGYQGFPQVAPAPPPELYHAGVTYYNPQPQHRPMMAPKPRTKLQLVEPPEKNKGDRQQPHLKDLIHHQQLEQHSQSPPLTTSSYSQDPASNVHGYVEQYELAEQFSGVSLTEMSSSESQIPVDPTVLLEQIRKPSPLPEQESWSAQMEETNDTPEQDRFEPNEVTLSTTTTEVIRPSSAQRIVETTSPSIEPPAAVVAEEEQPHSPIPPSTPPPPPPQIEEVKKDGEA